MNDLAVNTHARAADRLRTDIAPSTAIEELAAAEPASSLAHEPPGFQPLPRRDILKVLLGISLGMFLAAMNQTIVAAALPTIGRDLGDFENLSWIITSYLLTSTAVAPLYGKLADIHGRRAMMMIGLGGFLAGSVMCAVSPNMLTLILGR